MKKEAEKILKYKDLIIEIQRTWNVKTKVTPIIIRATGTSNTPAAYQESTISRNYRKQLYWAQHKTSESANVEAQKSLILKTVLYAPLTVRAE
jgi:hypothetical protein